VITDGLLAPTLLDPGVILPSFVRWDRLGPRIANGDLDMPASSGWPGPLHLDIWQAKPASRGAMLCFFTGPMELNVYQRRRAKSMGLAFSQNGLFDRETKQALPGTETEEGCYAALRMPYLTPNERQKWAHRR
jgi:DNA polymerase/3'-5' exonuclease PolX